MSTDCLENCDALVGGFHIQQHDHSPAYVSSHHESAADEVVVLVSDWRTHDDAEPRATRPGLMQSL